MAGGGRGDTVGAWRTRVLGAVSIFGHIGRETCLFRSAVPVDEPTGGRSLDAPTSRKQAANWRMHVLN